jgi:hypothetical protein
MADEIAEQERKADQLRHVMAVLVENQRNVGESAETLTVMQPCWNATEPVHTPSVPHIITCIVWPAGVASTAWSISRKAFSSWSSTGKQWQIGRKTKCDGTRLLTLA